MAFNVSDFKGELTHGGARSSLFRIDGLTFPGILGGGTPTKIPFHVRAAQIPASTITPLDVFYFGRPIRYAGNRTYADWTVTVLNDEDFQLRDLFEAWSSSIQSHERNTRTLLDGGAAAGDGTSSGYKQVAQVTQFGKKGEALRTYDFVGIFPIDIAAMELDWSNDAFQEFTVTFTYDYHRVSATGGPGAGATRLQAAEGSAPVAV